MILTSKSIASEYTSYKVQNSDIKQIKLLSSIHFKALYLKTRVPSQKPSKVSTGYKKHIKTKNKPLIFSYTVFHINIFKEVLNQDDTRNYTEEMSCWISPSALNH